MAKTIDSFPSFPGIGWFDSSCFEQLVSYQFLTGTIDFFIAHCCWDRGMLCFGHSMAMWTQPTISWMCQMGLSLGIYFECNEEDYNLLTALDHTNYDSLINNELHCEFQALCNEN